ncbi:unnamed protein product [Durusdinium trenchii]|uniref:Ubiquitin-like domain-containing protein n=1 Tax=Durusdinium trenchii TaxID=1381693 RepID=A0ABP0ISW0_9DINO
MAMEVEKIQVMVQKMSGEVLEAKVSPEDTVRELQPRIAEELGVPVLCQQLWINNVTPQIVEKTLPVMCNQVSETIQPITNKDIAEMKAMMRPPPICVDVLCVVMHLLGFKRRGNDYQAKWKDCRKMMANASHFRTSLTDWPNDVRNVPEKQVREAQKVIDEVGELYNREHFMKMSIACVYFCDWTLSALKLYRAVHSTGQVTSLRLDGPETRPPLNIYLEEGASSLLISLVVDFETVFAYAKSYDAKKVLEALEAFKVIAPKCTERCVPALCKCLRSDDQERIAAIECIKTAFQPDDDLAGAFAEALGAAHFTEHGTEEAVEALEYLGPQNPAALRCIIAGLNAKSQMLDEFLMLRRRRMKKKRAPVEEEEVDTDKNDAEKEMRQRCLEIFKQIEAKLSAAEVIDTLLKEILLATHNPVGGTPSSGVQQEAVMAFMVASKRDEDYAMARIRERLNPEAPEAFGEQLQQIKARCAFLSIAVASKDDEKLLEAFHGCLNDDQLRGPELQAVAECFSELSSGPNPFVQSLLQQLVLWDTKKAEVIRVIMKIAPKDDSRVIEAMQRYCREAERIILDEGPGILKMAAECLNHVVTDKSIYEKGITPAIDALIRKCTRSNLAQRDASQMPLMLQTQECRLRSQTEFFLILLVTSN